MPRPLCANCQRDMLTEAIGILVMFTAKFGVGGSQRPYKVHAADKFVCESCGNRVAIYNPKALWEHWCDRPVPDVELTIPE